MFLLLELIRTECNRSEHWCKNKAKGMKMMRYYGEFLNFFFVNLNNSSFQLRAFDGTRTFFGQKLFSLNCLSPGFVPETLLSMLNLPSLPSILSLKTQYCLFGEGGGGGT